MAEIIVVGDIYIGNDDDILNNLIINRNIKDIFHRSNLVLANLEGPLTNDNRAPLNNDFGLYSQAESIEFLKAYNINLVSLANNHIYDFGEDAVNFTIDQLNKNNIKQFGWGKNIHEIQKPVILHIDNISISFISISLHDVKRADTESAGTLPVNNELLFKTVIEAKKNSDVCIVSIHWGKELYLYPDPKDMEFAHNLIDKGVDLIVGHHPHIVQGMEKYNDKYIFYSLGNFVFNTFPYNGVRQPIKEEARKAMFVSFSISKSSVQDFEVHPIYYKPDLFIREQNKRESEIFISTFNRISREYLLPDYKSFYHKYRVDFELPVKKRIKEIYRTEGISLTLVPRFLKFLKKFYRVIILKN